MQPQYYHIAHIYLRQAGQVNEFHQAGRPSPPSAMKSINRVQEAAIADVASPRRHSRRSMRNGALYRHGQRLGGPLCDHGRVNYASGICGVVMSQEHSSHVVAATMFTTTPPNNSWVIFAAVKGVLFFLKVNAPAPAVTGANKLAQNFRLRSQPLASILRSRSPRPSLGRTFSQRAIILPAVVPSILPVRHDPLGRALVAAGDLMSQIVRLIDAPRFAWLGWRGIWCCSL